jgi:predicted enzyme related to lactoylglutathione lyase
VAHGNPIVRFEIGCDSTAKKKAFYETLFAWKIDVSGAGLAIDTGSAPGGGITAPGHEPRQYTLFYVQVDDVASALAKVAELGGKKIVDGDIRVVLGPRRQHREGNTVGLWQQKA